MNKKLSYLHTQNYHREPSGTGRRSKSMTKREPKVGMRISYNSYNNTFPATIVAVSKSGKSFSFRANDYKRIGDRLEPLDS